MYKNTTTKRKKSRIPLRTFLFFFCSAGILVDASLSGAENEQKPPVASGQYHAIIPRDAEPVLVYDGSVEKPELTFTEGPSWMDGKLYFSNYYMFWKKWRSSDEGGLRVIHPDGSQLVLNQNVQTCGTIPLANGNLAVCDLIARAVVEMSPEGKIVRTLADSYDGKRFGRPNDLVTDARGGIYFTDPNNAPKGKEKQPGNAIYYIDPEGTLTKLTGWNEFGFPNGCVLSPDGSTFYVNDARGITVWKYDVNDDGTLANKQPFTEILLPEDRRTRKNPRSDADGMTVDTLGNLYIATPMGIQIYDKNGESTGVIVYPKPPSNCIFGGEDMQTLYATCRDCIYSIRTKVKGLKYPPGKNQF